MKGTVYLMSMTFMLPCCCMLFSLTAACRYEGQTCSVADECCGKCCRYGLCFDSQACLGPLICGGSLCPPGYGCAAPGVVCSNGICNLRPQCVRLPYVVLNNIRDGCSLITCPPGTRCSNRVYPCLIPPCPQEVNCLAVFNPCAAISCPIDSRCVQNPNNPFEVTCVPNNPCTEAHCPVGSYCQSDNNYPLFYHCVSKQFLCAQVQCSSDQYCEIESLRCLIPPCPVRAICLQYINPCTFTKCPSGTTCVPDSNNPTTANCV